VIAEEQRGTLEISLANLHPIHTGSHCGRDGFHQIAACCAAIDDETENGFELVFTARARLRQSESRVQKLANPSSGLEADA